MYYKTMTKNELKNELIEYTYKLLDCKIGDNDYENYKRIIQGIRKEIAEKDRLEQEKRQARSRSNTLNKYGIRR